MSDETQGKLTPDEDLPDLPEELPEGYSIADAADHDFDQALRFAGAHAHAIAVLDGYDAALLAAYAPDIAAAAQKLKELQSALAAERYKIAQQRDARMRLLYWSFAYPFADRLPKRLKTILLPGALKFGWERQRSRQAWAENPTDPQDDLALKFLRGLPAPLQAEGIRLKPEVDRVWLNKHLTMPEEGEEEPPQFRAVDSETGEIIECDATVEIEFGGDVHAYPIKQTVPPKEPLSYTITYPDGRKSAYAGTTEEQEEEEHVSSSEVASDE